MTNLTPEETDLLFSLVETARGRQQIIEQLSVDHPDNWQSVSTPYDVVREMCDLVPDATHFCILFSLEFVEVLVRERNVPRENVIFFGDNALEADVAAHEKMYGVRSFVLSKNEIAGNGFNCSLLAEKLTQGVGTMKFDKLCCLMNPPYQMNDGGGTGSSAVPVYHNFITTIIDCLGPAYLVSINPSRWMVGGRGLDEFRGRMVADKRIKKVVHFPGEREVFPSVSIKGGVNYFLWDKNYNGKCEFVVGNSSTKRDLDEYDLVLQDNLAIPILAKVVSDTTKWLSSGVSSRKPFGIVSNFSNWTNEEGTKCYSANGNTHFCDSSVFTDKVGILNSWKVGLSKATIEGASFQGDVRAYINGGFVIEPGAICTETFLIVKAFKTKKEAENFITYMRTKFFRFMLGLRLATQNISKDKFAWVPDVGDYTTVWTDKELYDMFGLTRQERAYIESKIKELK